VIKELQYGFALPTLCLHSFWATEAALSLATLTYNLTILFQRHLGWQPSTADRDASCARRVRKITREVGAFLPDSAELFCVVTAVQSGQLMGTPTQATLRRRGNWWALRDLNPQPKDSSLRAFRRSLDYVITHGLTRCG